MGNLAILPEVEKKGWPWDEEVDINLYQGEDWPKISIVTPSYNQGDFLEETIRSILLQNYPNLEYIVMDGGSKDQSIDILKLYKPWIQVLVSEKDNGQSDALVKGFKLATGDFLNWINSDDILAKESLYQLAKVIKNQPDTNFIHGVNGIMDINSMIYSQMPHPKDNLKLRYIYEMPYGQQACFFSKDLYEKAGGINKGLRFSMDYELYLRMHLVGSKATQIDNLLGNIRIHGNTKTAQLEEVMHFENGNAFYTYLKSSGQNGKALFMQALGHDNYAQYAVEILLSKKEMEQIYCNYLRKNIWYYYNNDEIRKARKMAIEIIKSDKKEIINLNYLKIIKDGTIKILQSSWTR